MESHVSGEAPLGKELNEATTEGAHKAELIAAPVLVIVLLLVFQVAGRGGHPADHGTGHRPRLVRGRVDHPQLHLARRDRAEPGVGVGLALGVDYSLLIITRFRERSTTA